MIEDIFPAEYEQGMVVKYISLHASLTREQLSQLERPFHAYDRFHLEARRIAGKRLRSLQQVGLVRAAALAEAEMRAEAIIPLKDDC